MNHVAICPGGILLARFDNEELDVSDRAIEYLFDTALLEQGVLLRDIFLVLQANPGLSSVFRRLWCKEVVESAFKGEAPPKEEYDPTGVDYLEIERLCFYDENIRKYSSLSSFDMRGVGFILKEPWHDGDLTTYPKGSRNGWCLYGMPPRKLMNYPVTLETTNWVYINRRTGKMLKTYFGPPMLGQIFYAVLYTLSYFGSEEDVEALAKAFAEQEFTPVDIDAFQAHTPGQEQ